MLSDCRLECDKVQWSRMAPKELPDLFRGSRVVVAGRYSGSGPTAIRLHGTVKGQKTSYVFEGLFPEQTTENDFVASLWAQRRVGVLLEAIRLNGRNPELIAEIQRLGKEHGIVTPYTSHLIVEENERVARRFRGGAAAPGNPAMVGRADDRVREELRRAGHNAPAEGDEQAQGPAGAGPTTPAPQTAARRAKKKLEELDAEKSGKDAVDQSIDTGRLAFLDSLSRNRSDRLWTTQRVAGRVLHFVGGVWVDGRYTREHEKKLEKIEAFSDAYFALLRSKPELAKLFAFSTSIVTLVGERAIQIVPAKPAKSDKTEESGK